MNKRYYEHVARTTGLTTYHYKALFALYTKPMSQKDVAEIIGVSHKNMFRVFKPLLDKNLIEIVRKDGNNKIFRAITSIDRLDPKQ